MQKTAAYLGPVASYSHQAALALFPSSASVRLEPLPTFTDIFNSLQSSTISYGVIPFENSSNGSVIQTLDLLADRDSRYRDIRVVGEYYLSVHHCLLAQRFPRQHGREAPKYRTTASQEIKDIRKIYTHPQAWGQCENFLSTHLKSIERQDVSSTSKAAELVSHETGSAAIASTLAAEVSELDILASNIEDSGDNTTRFFVFSKLSDPQTDGIAIEEELKTAHTPTPNLTTSGQTKSKSLISFTVNHATPGALAQALEIFKQHSFNLTSIDTRPSRRRAWHYIFFVECEHGTTGADHGGDGEKEVIEDMIQHLETVAESCRFWGSWEDRL